MKKLDFKTLLLDKGEKIALYACGGLMALLIAVGGYSAVDASNPTEIKTNLEKEATKIESQVNSPAATVPQLPAWATTAYHPDTIDSRKFAVNLPLFDPIARPDDKRANPVVLRPVEFQADYVPAKIPAHDIIEDTVNGERILKIGLITVKERKGQQAPDLGQWRSQFVDKIKKIPRGRGYPLPPQNTGGNVPGAPGGFPGAPGSFPGAPGGFPGMTPPNLPRGPGGMTPMTPPSFPGAGDQFNANEQRNQVIYVPLDDDKDMANKRLALTLLTQRLVVLQAAFPYKDQLEEIRKALKLNSVAEVFATEGAAPHFRGQSAGGERGPSVEVERRTIFGAGKVSEWQPLNYVDGYRPVFMRKIADQPDPPDLEYIKLPVSNRLVMPLPYAFQTNYPDLRLDALTKTVAKLKEVYKGAVVQQKAPNQLKGEGDIFAPQNAPQNAGNLFGAPGGDGGMDPRMMMNMIGPNPLSGLRTPATMPGMASDTGNAVPAGSEPIDYCLVRIIDTDIRPGVQYQYRMRLHMENPNHKKRDLVSKPSDADVEVLTGEWAAMEGTVSVPPESYLYAIEPPPTSTRGPLSNLKEGQAVMQIQRWQSQVQIDRHKEPFGDWFVADMPVTRGQYVGARVWVNLPLWSSELNSFVVRETPPEKQSKGRMPAEPRKGVLMDLARPDLLVVDVEGGRVSRFPGTNKKPVDDESVTEVLLMSDDGRLRVHNTRADHDDPARQQREKRWKAWVEEVEKGGGKPAAPPGPGQTGGNRFE